MLFPKAQIISELPASKTCTTRLDDSLVPSLRCTISFWAQRPFSLQDVALEHIRDISLHQLLLYVLLTKPVLSAVSYILRNTVEHLPRRALREAGKITDRDKIETCPPLNFISEVIYNHRLCCSCSLCSRDRRMPRAILMCRIPTTILMMLTMSGKLNITS